MSRNKFSDCIIIFTHPQWLVIYLVISLFSCQHKQADQLVLATAANMQYVMEELVRSFTNETNIACQIVIGSSGKHTAQIRAGAPFDVFISADTLYPNILWKDRLTLGRPLVYGFGNLILWSFVDSAFVDLEKLSNPAIKHIAMANPKTAPYGRLTQQILLDMGLAESVNTKLVYGESIAQTNQFIQSESAEVGFTAKSSLYAPGLTENGYWYELPEASLPQALVVLKNTSHPNEARQFLGFMQSEKALNLLQQFGYSEH